MTINREFFGKKPKLKVKKVNLTSNSAYVRELTGKEYADFERKVFDKEGSHDVNEFKTELVLRSLCDSKGERVLNDDEGDKLINGLSMADILLLTIAVRQVNHMDEDVEALAGKS